MGDILSGVFGGGEQTAGTLTATGEAKELNKIKLEELKQLFGKSDMSAFAKPQPGLYTPSNAAMGILQQATGRDNQFSLQNYMDAGLSAGKSYMSQIATPEIMSAMALQGQERSGAVPEALAKGAAGIALPFVQSLPGAMGQIGQANQGLFSMADLPRQMQQEDFMRQQGVVQTGFTGIPFSPSQAHTNDKSSLPLWNMFGTGGSA